jgi:Arc/MetJ family transcription regulator
LFAEPPADPTPPLTDPAEPPADPAPPTDPKPPAKMYTQEEVEKMMKDRVAREKKAAEEALEEAKKLAKMNEDEKAKYELEKLQRELAEYKKKDAFNGLSKEASKMLSEQNIHADDELLAFVVKGDAEATKLAVDSFVALVNTKISDGVKQALSGTPPKASITTVGGAKNPFSKEHFNLTEQGRLKKEDPERYKILKALAGK